MNGNIDEVRLLEQSMLNAWPSTRVVHSDGWVFRHAGNYTKRANSAQALAPTGPFAPVLANARAFYVMHGQPATFRLTPLANPDADGLLAENGFDCVDPTIVMASSLSRREGTDGSVTIATTFTDDWTNAHATARDLSNDEMGGHISILRTIALPMAFATWRVDSEPAAFGLGVLDHGRLGLFDIVTLPNARRKGGARAIVSALLAWGQSCGAHTAWLSVLAGNAPAIALYRQLGFAQAYEYRYRQERWPTAAYY